MPKPWPWLASLITIPKSDNPQFMNTVWQKFSVPKTHVPMKMRLSLSGFHKGPFNRQFGHHTTDSIKHTHIDPMIEDPGKTLEGGVRHSALLHWATLGQPGRGPWTPSSSPCAPHSPALQRTSYLLLPVPLLTLPWPHFSKSHRHHHRFPTKTLGPSVQVWARFQKESTVIELIHTNTELPAGQELIMITPASYQPLCMLGTMPSSCWAPLHSTLPVAHERCYCHLHLNDENPGWECLTLVSPALAQVCAQQAFDENRGPLGPHSNNHQDSHSLCSYQAQAFNGGFTGQSHNKILPITSKASTTPTSQGRKPRLGEVGDAALI